MRDSPCRREEGHAPRPLRDNVWLRFPGDETRNAGGVLVEVKGERRLDATVVAAGPDVPPDVGVGDRVLANRFDGMPVDYDGQLFRSVPYSKLVAMLT